LDAALSLAMKRKLKRIVSMLTRIAMKFDGVVEAQTEYNAIDDYEHEHRCAEHEHEVKATIYGPEVASAIREGKLKILAGTYLKVGPPWPDAIRDESGKLPEYVVADGLEWRATTLQELHDSRKLRDNATKTSLTRRARTEILLVVDGKIVDLNRIKLPNSVVDKRFQTTTNP
jgi:hypothetical protein